MESTKLGDEKRKVVTFYVRPKGSDKRKQRCTDIIAEAKANKLPLMAVFAALCCPVLQERDKAKMEA